MKKLLGLVALAGYLGYNLMAPNVIAQSRYSPIRFGKDKEYSYSASYDKEESSNFEVLGRAIKSAFSGADKVRLIDISKNWGKIYIGEQGDSVVWGVLDGVLFYSEKFIDTRKIDITKRDVTVQFDDIPKASPGNDHATVNLEYVVALGNPGFYEGPVPIKPWEQLTLQERLHSIYSFYSAALNLKEVEQAAQKSKVVIPPNELRKSLDIFLKEIQKIKPPQ